MRISDWSSYVCSSDLNDHLVSLISNVDKQLHLFRRRGLVQTGKMQSSNQEHEQILAALAAHDHEQAGALMEQHIIAGKNRLLATLKERSEENTSELQSLMRNSYAVFCLKKTTTHDKHKETNIKQN